MLMYIATYILPGLKGLRIFHGHYVDLRIFVVFLLIFSSLTGDKYLVT
jgi:hypothetical protein